MLRHFGTLTLLYPIYIHHHPSISCYFVPLNLSISMARDLSDVAVRFYPTSTTCTNCRRGIIALEMGGGGVVIASCATFRAQLSSRKSEARQGFGTFTTSSSYQRTCGGAKYTCGTNTLELRTKAATKGVTSSTSSSFIGLLEDTRAVRSSEVSGVWNQSISDISI